MQNDKQKWHVLVLSFTLILSVLLAGCAKPTGTSYSNKQARTAHTVNYGTIKGLADAYIEDDATGLGTLGGAVVGGVAGSALGGGTGRLLFALGGAVLGGLVGTGVEKSMRSHDAVEITITLDNGETLAIVQALGDEERSFVVGDKVRVLRGKDGSARVRR